MWKSLDRIFETFLYFDHTGEGLIALIAYVYVDKVIQPNKQTEDKRRIGIN